MGIQGLLPLLKSIQKPVHLRNFAGQVIGVDAYGWLHRGTVACAIELAQQKPTRKHIDFALNRVTMLLNHGVRPYLVFDGDYLPSKAHTERERAVRRQESRKSGLELLAMGRSAQAQLELQKAVDVTPSMARELIEELKRLGVPYVVAPYEADAQLAYLEQQKVISAVLSEDSDLLVFGVKCLLTKLDGNGECVMINRAHFTACREISLVGWTDSEFRMMAMMSGCDYLPSLEHMGLKTAYRLVRQHKTIKRIIQTLQFDGKRKIPAGYLESFTNAERTFLYPWAFCPEARALVNLNKVPAELDIADMPYLGAYVEPKVAAGVAAGDLDPNTKRPLSFNTLSHQYPSRARLMQTPDEKPGKPISEFFKPRRTPLAELDPNSFTPSPSQRHLLQNQQTASWSASHAPSALPSPLERVDSVSASLSAPQVSRRATGPTFASAQRSAPKRPRLCAEELLAAQMDGSVGVRAGTSRFFDKHVPEPSPSARPSQNRRLDFELWSDDSTADAVAALTANQEAESEAVEALQETTSLPVTLSPKKRKKIAVYVDTAETVAADHPAATSSVKLSHEVLSSADVDGSQTADEHADTPATSFDSARSRADETVFSKGLGVQFAALGDLYALGAPSREVFATDSRPDRSRPDSSEARTATIVEVAASSPPAVHDELVLELGGCDVDEHDWIALKQQGLDEAPLPPPVINGSEDLIVPNSPDGSCAADWEVHELAPVAPRLNLGRFAFAG